MINQIINEGIVEQICKNIGVSSKYVDDLIQEIYMILLEYDRQKIIEMYERGQLNFFITRIIKNQWCSNTSPFYKKYRKYYEYADDNYNNYIGVEMDDIDERDREIDE